MLLVEGRNDQYVMRNLLGEHDISCVIPDRGRITSDDIIVQQAGNAQKLLDRLRVILDDGDLELLGVVIDADTDLDARWQSLTSILNDFGGTNLPKSPSHNGTITELDQVGRTLRVGVWIMPDNQVPGILEDFIQFLIPDNDELWPRARGCVASIPEEERRFSDVAIPKAEIHTWLACQEKPGQPLGIAITAKYLDCNAPHAIALVDWARRLFSP
jgi:hypothetical protein